MAYEEVDALPEDGLRKILKGDSSLWDWFGTRTKIRVSSRARTTTTG
jgi:hypothetical protein